jgi:hypothetical protein
MDVNPMFNQQIIDEADRLVPNAHSILQKVAWLNEINREYFETVKVPRVTNVPYSASNDEYGLDTDVRFRNIDKVVFGSEYRSAADGAIAPGRNTFMYNDESGTLTLIPAPLTDGVGIVRYFRTAETVYTEASVSAQSPDAAVEYHSAYVYGLAERIAKANEDLTRANQYGTEYRNALMIASQNYSGGGANANQHTRPQMGGG